MPDEPELDWLAGYEPAHAALRARSVLTIASPACVIWDQLVAAPSWPRWFPLSTAVRLPDGKTGLDAGMSFRWTMQGVRFVSTIYQFEPYRRLAWRSLNPLISTCHIWALEPRDGRTAVITDETQRGLLPTVLGIIVKPKLKRGQRVWLDALGARVSVLQRGLDSEHGHAT